MKIENKIALITGGAQGIGYSIAEKYCSEGACVFIGDMNEKQGRQAVENLAKYAGYIFFLPLDVTKEESWTSVVSHIIHEKGRLDILVNNAGINIRKIITEISADELDKMYSVNIKGPFLGIKYTLPIFEKQHEGIIINISSVCGLVGHKYTPEAYTTTKGAITLLTKSIASRYGKYNIRCNSIHPSTVKTALVEEFLKDPEKLRERIGEVPLGRLALPSDIAEAALFLASDSGAFINGVSLPVDGGVTAW